MSAGGALAVRFAPRQHGNLADVLVLVDGRPVTTLVSDGPTPAEGMVSYDLAEAGYGLASPWHVSSGGEWRADLFALPELVECPSWCREHPEGTLTSEAVVPERLSMVPGAVEVPRLLVSHEAAIGTLKDGHDRDLVHVDLLAISVVDAAGFTHNRPGAVMYTNTQTPPFLGPVKARELAGLLALAAERVSEAREVGVEELRADLDLTGTTPEARVFLAEQGELHRPEAQQPSLVPREQVGAKSAESVYAEAFRMFTDLTKHFGDDDLPAIAVRWLERMARILSDERLGEVTRAALAVIAGRAKPGDPQ